MFALNKGRCYFYHSIAAGGEWGGGCRNIAEGFPRTAVIHCLRAIPREGSEITLKWLKLLDFERGFIWSTRWLHIISRFFLFFFTSLAKAAIYFSCCRRCWALIRVRWKDDDDSLSVLLAGWPPPPPLAPIVLPLRGDELAPAYAGDREHMPCDKQC